MPFFNRRVPPASEHCLGAPRIGLDPHTGFSSGLPSPLVIRVRNPLGNLPQVSSSQKAWSFVPSPPSNTAVEQDVLLLPLLSQALKRTQMSTLCQRKTVSCGRALQRLRTWLMSSSWRSAPQNHLRQSHSAPVFARRDVAAKVSGDQRSPSTDSRASQARGREPRVQARRVALEDATIATRAVSRPAGSVGTRGSAPLPRVCPSILGPRSPLRRRRRAAGPSPWRFPHRRRCRRRSDC